MMNKDENRIVLLQEGEITRGEVYQSKYETWAPEGWEIVYKFNIKNSSDAKNVTYWGEAEGPKFYYANLHKGDTISVIYYPGNPKINCEMYYFLNHPSYRHTFKKAGKLHLLDKFRDEYEVKDYALVQWYDLQRQK